MSKTVEKFSGKQCLHGHSGVRYRSTGGCVECACEKANLRYAKRLAEKAA